MSFNIWNRRYTGSKFKLSDWIFNTIEENCIGKSFCDIFAGTGVISAKFSPFMDTIHINDFLHSNSLIHYAFFHNSDFSQKIINDYAKLFTSLDSKNLEENYFSINFGGKFFSNNDAKTIGYIRQTIEDNCSTMNLKEKSILIASLLYSADRAANTVGHYDAYIKGRPILDKFNFSLISPYKNNGCKFHITQQDANELGKEIQCDIVYVDPPYNSRQYSRFYHVLENLTTWEKPELFGTALKPAPTNMSDYCKVSAPRVFNELINSLNCKYIAVSYNNTYASKSSSSRNKIELEQIQNTLRTRGKTRQFEMSHQCFNAGKTKFNDHKEFVFVVEVT